MIVVAFRGRNVGSIQEVGAHIFKGVLLHAIKDNSVNCNQALYINICKKLGRHVPPTAPMSMIRNNTFCK